LQVILLFARDRVVRAIGGARAPADDDSGGESGVSLDGDVNELRGPTRCESMSRSCVIARRLLPSGEWVRRRRNVVPAQARSSRIGLVVRSARVVA
jgi:hypothetical protein